MKGDTDGGGVGVGVVLGAALGLCGLAVLLVVLLTFLPTPTAIPPTAVVPAPPVEPVVPRPVDWCTRLGGRPGWEAFRCVEPARPDLECHVLESRTNMTHVSRSMSCVQVTP